MRFDNVNSYDVVDFICRDSPCNKNCCMIQVFGRCFDIAEAWKAGHKREGLYRAMMWRVKHGERTMGELLEIGINPREEVL